MKLSERLGWIVASLIGGAVLGGSVIALLEIGTTLGELRCRLAPDSPTPPDPGHEQGR